MSRLAVGDTILYKRKKVITEWEINRFSPSGKFVAIENDDWDERWVNVHEILEVIERANGEPLIQPTTEVDPEKLLEIANHPISRAATPIRSTKDYNFDDKV